ncbi:MAG: glycosyltransferase family 2 protein [Fidelibacterota bacterium]|nr:MAG: glycosyltransferase family 2 protein [Candidatus Neomarinimicrobiota bacterium]
MAARISFIILDGFNVIALSYFLLLNIVYLVTSIVAFRALQVYVRRLKAMDIEELISTAGAPPITLISPAYNEEATCIEAIKSLLLLKYSDYEILAVNDGSTDQTLTRLKDAFELAPADRAPTANIPTAAVRGIYHSQRLPNLWVIDKENGGKADALNIGINYCRTPLFCSMDADTLLEREALIRSIRPFLEDARTVAAGGIIRIANGCEISAGSVTKVRLPKKLLAQFQVLEYLRAFMAGRMGWDALDLTLIISGAFGVFRRSIVVDVGGYATDTVGEDMELIVRIHRHCREKKIPYRISYIADPIAWTECPEKVTVLGRQRDRWQRGLYETVIRHRGMLLNRRYGRIGLVAFPYFFLLEMLGPLIEFFGYLMFILAVALGRASGPYIIVFFMAAFIFGVVLSIAAVALEELSFHRYPRLTDLIRLFGLAVLENFGYRQLTSYWRIRGFFSGVRQVKGWGKMERKGFAVETTG